MVKMKAGQGAVTQVLPTTDYRSTLDAVYIYIYVKYVCVYKHLCFYSCVKNIHASKYMHVYTQLCFISVQNYLREPLNITL